MSEIIYYDFKNKKKIEEYKAWEVQCTICLNIYSYDSRKDKEIPLLLSSGRSNICEHCITEMYELIKDKK